MGARCPVFLGCRTCLVQSVAHLPTAPQQTLYSSSCTATFVKRLRVTGRATPFSCRRTWSGLGLG